MDGVEVARDLAVRLVRRGRGERVGHARGGERVLVGERDSLTLRGTVAKEVGDDRVALAVVPVNRNRADLDELLERITNEDVARDRDRAVVDLVLVRDLAAKAENEGGASGEGLVVVRPLEPLLAPEHTNVRVALKLDDVVRLLDRLEGILEVVEAAAVEECGDDLDNGLVSARRR